MGGGVAGLTAALGAARNGAETLLVERYGFLGGTATAGLMTSFNGFRNEHPALQERLTSQGAVVRVPAEER